MAHICRGRTVPIIAHHLCAVRTAHRIIVRDKGQIVESRPHDELMKKQNGLYAHLWRMQDGGKPMDAGFLENPKSRTLTPITRIRSAEAEKTRHTCPTTPCATCWPTTKPSSSTSGRTAPSWLACSA